MVIARKGSILFTAVSMTAVFLTLVVTSLSYVQSSTQAATTDRFRDTAEQAARSGVDWVMGFAEQNIDTQSRLPKDWNTMIDGQVINPVASYVTGPVVADVNTLYSNNPSDQTGLGSVLGASTNGGGFPTGVGELIIGRQGNYITTFKARLQQYSFSDDAPRQYRLGVVGRVRKAQMGPAARPGSVNTNERDTIVAESYIVVNIGQVPTSRYAALIDIDGVKNWVPGEVVNGPVHINRGYVDSKVETATNGAKFKDYSSSAGIATDITNFQIPTSAGSFPANNLRSIMNLRTAAGSPFSAVAGDPDYGTLTAPKFNDEVTITAIKAGDATASTYTNLDPWNVGTGLANASNVGTAVQVDGQPFNISTASGTLQNAMFVAPENHHPDKSFGMGLSAAPNVLNQPVSLPSSVRNRLPQILGGIPLGSAFTLNSPTWANLPDGIYMPTDGFWTSGATGGYDGAPGNYLKGGIYIRGNVEVMRMGVTTNTAGDGISYFLFTLGYGKGVTAANPKRNYCVVMNRNTRESWLLASPYASGTPGIGPTGGAFMFSTAFAGWAASGNSIPTGAGYTGGATPASFAITAGGKPAAYFPPSPGANDMFPFNGCIFVDISKDDLARDTTNVNNYNNVPPITGNIFALGDPGTGGPPGTKRLIDGLTTGGAHQMVPYESVATYMGTVRSNPACRLNIMATGNIFVQNDIALDSLRGLVGTTGAHPFPDMTFAEAEGVGLSQTRDLLGIVADKQIVLGISAPSTTTRQNKGVAIHGAIAALGDPGFNYVTKQADPRFMTGTQAYRGSFTTEGLMQYYNVTEDYLVCDGGPRQIYEPGALPAAIAGMGFTSSSRMAANGYPGIPLYGDWGQNTSFVNDPNGTATRGRAIVFGAVTMKKRGILGKGDTSYDKRFFFDHRLLTIAPPIFPSSTDVVIRTSAPSTPTGLPYKGGPAGTGDFQFMKTP